MAGGTPRKGNNRMTDTKGMTLVELVVAFALAALLFVSLIGVVAPVYRVYQRTRAQADALLMAGNVVDAIRTTANIAKEVTADGNRVKVGNRLTYYTQGGKLVYDVHTGSNPKSAVPVFDERYYDGKSIALVATQEGANIVALTVSVTAGNMPPASTTAIISPIRRILLDSVNSAAEGATTRAREIIAANPTASPDDLFDALYPAPAPGEPDAFPTFDIHTILTANRLNTLRVAAENDGTAVQRAFLATLTDGRAFYLATYMTANSAANGGTQPVAYITDMTLAQVRAAGQANATVYFAYFDGTWYIRNPETTGAAPLTEFDGKSDGELRAYFASGTGFIPADTYRIP